MTPKTPCSTVCCVCLRLILRIQDVFSWHLGLQIDNPILMIYVVTTKRKAGSS
jgi:hypothetical protein